MQGLNCMALLLSFAEEDAEKEEEDEDEAEHLTRELLSCFVVVVVVVAPTGARSTRAQDLAAIVYRAS